uniref:Uncharacterized protein n=1 Tax=Amphimedon queenslandica TaxID=400682 RepID=A0A1X7SWY6_AMPQE
LSVEVQVRRLLIWEGCLTSKPVTVFSVVRKGSLRPESILLSVWLSLNFF